MRRIAYLCILIGICICTSCSKQVIEEPQLDNPYNPGFEYGDFPVTAMFVTDVRASIIWRGKSLGGRFDIFLNDTLHRTVEKTTNDTLAIEDIYHLTPNTNYDIKVRWVPQDGSVKFGKVSFTTEPRFLLQSYKALNLDKFAFESYTITKAIRSGNGMLFTLTCKKSAYNVHDYVIVIKADPSGEVVWDREFAHSGYRNTKIMWDGSILLVTRKNVYHISSGGDLLAHYNFDYPQEKGIEIRDAAVLKDGRIVVVGSSVRKWGKDDTLWEEYYVASLSQDGRILSETISSVNKFNKFERIEMMDNGNLLTAGVTGNGLHDHEPGTRFEYSYYNGTFTTAILNSDAQIVKNNEHEGFGCCKTAGSAKGEDGNFYFLVRDMYDSYWGTANCSGIVGMDSNGNMIRHMTYDNPSSNPYALFVSGEEIIITQDVSITQDSRILLTEKLGEKTSEWHAYGYKFIYAEKEDDNILCIDQYGNALLFNIKGYVKYPFEIK